MNNVEQENYGFKFQLDDFQVEAISCINKLKNVVVCAPTGAGKTVIAEYAIMKALEEGKRLFYTTPLKALSNQKFHDFSEAYGKDKIGLLTGDISINRQAKIVVMTTEVFRNMLYGTTLGKVEENLKNVNFVVLDEVHYMNDEQRGTVWEESIIYCPGYINIIALSATIANAVELTDWINEVQGETYLVNSDFRPVPLRHFYYSDSCADRILPLFSAEGRLNKKIKPEKKFRKYIKASKKDEKTHVKLIKILNDRDMLPAIYFAFSRKRCNGYLEDCRKLKLLNNFEERRLSQIIDEYILDNPYIARSKQLEYLYHGVAAHHAGLLPGWKGLIEKLFQQGLIKVVFATETLAAGINMPARTTIISSISKRSDEGHRVLTSSEFLQMSGRAGRRGMDEVGYVITIGDPYHHPEEMAELASSTANPLESKFTPRYSMVLNLLQRFTIEEARELILKSFGYHTSVERLKPLHTELERIEGIIEDITGFKCPYYLTAEDVKDYNKFKNMFIQYRKTLKVLKKQVSKGEPYPPEVEDHEQKTRELENKVKQSKCDMCKNYKKHIRNLEILPRFDRKYRRIKDSIEYEKDIYWRQFLNLMKVAELTGHLENNYPTRKGFMTAAARVENEIFFIELIVRGILDDLSCAELAAVICAIVTEETRSNFYQKYKIGKKVRKALYESQDLMKKLWRMQQEYDVTVPVNLTADYSGFIENWALGVDWEELVAGSEVDEGDLVRIFKRTLDLLRQLTMIPDINRELVKTAIMAIDCINRDPVSEVI